MQKLVLTISILFFLSTLNFAQKSKNRITTTKDSTKIIHDTYRDHEDLKKKQEELGIEQLTYIDSTFSFKLLVPSWFNYIDTDDPRIFVGMLPPVDDISNAIAIKSYFKKGKSFEEFAEYIVEHMVVGQFVNWSADHIAMGKKELEEYQNLGKSYKVYLMQGKLIYHCQYLLIETATAYLWIDYTATPTTFAQNKDKFDEFLKGFEKLK